MVRIRLLLLGKPGQRSFRIVVIDSRYKRNSNNFLKILGYYNPRTKVVKLEKEELQKWLSRGAQPTLAVEDLIKKHSQQDKNI